VDHGLAQPEDQSLLGTPALVKRDGRPYDFT
jgi:hypothetical protein